MADTKPAWVFDVEPEALPEEAQTAFNEALSERTDIVALKYLGAQEGKLYKNFAILVRINTEEGAEDKLGLALVTRRTNVRDNSVKFSGRVNTFAI